MATIDHYLTCGQNRSRAKIAPLSRVGSSKQESLVDLVVYAVPFFILAMLVELGYGPGEAERLLSGCDPDLAVEELVRRALAGEK